MKKEESQLHDYPYETIRLHIKDRPLMVRAIFELIYFSPISILELINLYTSDIDFEKKAIRLNRGNGIVLIPITDKCLHLLKQLCSSSNSSDTPLLLNEDGKRISLGNLWFITRSFAIEPKTKARQRLKLP